MTVVANNQEPIKVVFWDLDGTLWSGTLGEDSTELLTPYPDAITSLKELDRKGILNSLVTQASQEAAQAHLQALGLYELFVQPAYNVGSKARAIATGLTVLNLLPINAALIDDQAFHRAEVKALLPDILVLPARQAASLPAHPRCQAAFTLGVRRRQMVQAEAKRGHAESVFTGNRGEFLQACKMQLHCRQAQPIDMPRFTELMQRAHRLSASGPPSDKNTDEIPADGNNRFYIGELSDRYGDYGLIAAAQIKDDPVRHGPICIRLAISCRAQGRGVVESFLRWLVNIEGENMAICTAITPVNQPLRSALRLCGFGCLNVDNDGELLVLLRPERLNTSAWMTVTEGEKTT